MAPENSNKKSFVWKSLRISFWVMIICFLLGLTFYFGPESWGWSQSGMIILGIIFYVLPISIASTFILSALSIYRKENNRSAWIFFIISLVCFALAGAVYAMGWFLSKLVNP
ncbi:MAG: hypothetical protein KJ905_03940 [Nanoarchaeota archaeon]|nr:hypothetical protein [Nanoarchaeota archaeon]MBU1501891.1 hypothetical protein [Nanoarchaeota archaeon]